MDLSYNINKKPAYVFDHLTDMQKFAAIHPVITAIDKTGGNKYLVHETLKAGPFAFSFKYPVTINADAQMNTIVMKAVVMKITTVEMTFILKPQQDGTRVNENITFRSPLPIRSVLEKVFKEQHALLFRNMGSRDN